jgi:hypothetical protein
MKAMRQRASGGRHLAKSLETLLPTVNEERRVREEERRLIRRALGQVREDRYEAAAKTLLEYAALQGNRAHIHGLRAGSALAGASSCFYLLGDKRRGAALFSRSSRTYSKAIGPLMKSVRAMATRAPTRPRRHKSAMGA